MLLGKETESKFFGMILIKQGSNFPDLHEEFFHNDNLPHHVYII